MARLCGWCWLWAKPRHLTQAYQKPWRISLQATNVDVPNSWLKNKKRLREWPNEPQLESPLHTICKQWPKINEWMKFERNANRVLRVIRQIHERLWNAFAGVGSFLTNAKYFFCRIFSCYTHSRKLLSMTNSVLIAFRRVLLNSNFSRKSSFVIACKQRRIVCSGL